MRGPHLAVAIAESAKLYWRAKPIALNCLRATAVAHASPAVDAQTPAAAGVVDETGTATKMTRLRGRARGEQRLKMKAPFGHWGTGTFIGAMRHAAPWVIDCPMHRRIFEHRRSFPASGIQTGRGSANSGQAACHAKFAKNGCPSVSRKLFGADEQTSAIVGNQ